MPSDTSANIATTQPTGTQPPAIAAPTLRSSKENMGALLHARLGHTGNKNLRATLEELGGTYKGLIHMLQHPCRACDAGKMTRRPSKGHLPRGRFYGDVLHADIQEYELADMHGNWYNLMLVEDVSRGKWSVPLKLKSCKPEDGVV